MCHLTCLVPVNAEPLASLADDGDGGEVVSTFVGPTHSHKVLGQVLKVGKM